jgi:hypothetical protein
MVLGNRIAGPSAGKRSSSKKKGSTGGKRNSKGTKRRAKGAKRVGGPRANKGWKGPTPTKQVRGSNTTGAAKRAAETRKEDAASKGHDRAKAQATKRRTARTAPDKRVKGPSKTAKGNEPAEEAQETQEGPRTIEITMDGNLHGPEKMDAFKSKADEMVVGERTVIHHAARYGIVRGMTWTVILSALLFWLPIVGPAIAGYVGGRKAGGPLRGIIAVIIPAMVMFVILAAATENMDLVPTGMTSGLGFDPESLAELPAQTIPMVSGLQQTINSWATTPPDVMFIMLVFALVGGALSALRRREEETVIEKVGIPLGELKERILREEAGKDGTVFADPPSRWEPHPVISGPVAAHDAFNELVEDIAQKVYIYMQGSGMVGEPDNVKTPGRKRSRRRSGKNISTGEKGPHYGDMVSVSNAQEPINVSTPVASGGRRSRKGASARSNTAPHTVGEAIMGDAEDWEVVDTSKGRRPIRVVRSPQQDGVAMMPEHSMAELESQAAPPPVVFEDPEEVMAPAADDLPEPAMYVEEKPHGLFRRSKKRVVYPTVSPGQGRNAPVSPHGDGSYEEPEDVTPVQRNYERLPIVGSIYKSMEREAEEDIAYTGSLKSMEEPTIHDTMEASSIANSAARELAEIARIEEGPDMEPEEDDLPPESRKRAVDGGELDVDTVGEIAEETADGELDPEPEPEPPRAPKAKRSRSKPRAKSTARKVKHPTGSLKSRGKKDHHEEVYEEGEALVGVVEWDGNEDDTIEEEDLFNPRRLEDDHGEDEGPEEGSEAWAEEERIASIVREREEWDRL